LSSDEFFDIHDQGYFNGRCGIDFFTRTETRIPKEAGRFERLGRFTPEKDAMPEGIETIRQSSQNQAKL